MHRSAVVMAGLLLLSSCKDSKADGDGARTTVPTASSSTSTTAVSYEVPATIDAAYIEKVMAALDHVYGEAARYIAKSRKIDEQFLTHLVAIYSDRYFSLVQSAWAEVAGDDFELLSPSPGDPDTSVVRVTAASPSCIVFEATRNFSPVFREPDPTGRRRFVALIPMISERNLAGHNPTPWIMNFDGSFESGNEPTQENACLPL